MRSRGIRFAVSVAAALLVLSGAAPVSAHGRVVIGAGIGFPVYAYPYAYPYPYPYYYSYPYVGPSPWVDYAPPPGWLPGQFEWRYDPSGRRYRAWVPAHLR
jgi:hypothetical protein